MTNLTELLRAGGYAGAHHVRLISTEGDVVAHAAVSADEEEWYTDAYASVHTLYGHVCRQATADICLLADEGREAAIAAIEGLLSAALASGDVTPEMKIKDVWVRM